MYLCMYIYRERSIHTHMYIVIVYGYITLPIVTNRICMIQTYSIHM